VQNPRAAGPILAALLLFAGLGSAAAATADHHVLCDDNAPLCTETYRAHNYEGRYIGHDEPSLLFYSDVSGSGNSSTYLLRLPKDPPSMPQRDGNGGTFGFQLHPAFWFGMALCDSQSSPNPGMPCMPNSDANIFDNPDPFAADYVGKHPGTAFLEVQFYPPGWVPWPQGISCDALRWCAALTIDSVSANPNTGQQQNDACASKVGVEYLNFAFVTRDGAAQAPANPVEATAATYTVDTSRDLLMNSGDWLSVAIHDGPNGLEVEIRDLTSGDSGSMTASAANGFGQVAFDPDGSGCVNIPYDFHPMYSTSSEHTRVPWAAHSYSIAFSDELGHFEYCDGVGAKGKCKRRGASDPGGRDRDDIACFRAGAALRVRIAGCIGSDTDFDGPAYQPNWPGSLPDPAADRSLHPSSVLVSSPRFQPSVNPLASPGNFERVAFETDLPRVEGRTVPPCRRRTGAGCAIPPAGAQFYPFYSTRQSPFGCVWQLGGPYIPGTQHDFGGDAASEFGGLLALAYPTSKNAAVLLYNDFRRVLRFNFCTTGRR
jgi:hypothetical protein